MITSKQDANQVLKLAFDDATQSIRTQSTGTPSGEPIPDTATLVAGENPSGDQQPLQTDVDGALMVTFAPTAEQTVIQPDGADLHVTVDASALPTGAATSANQVTANASLASIDTKLTAPLSVTGPLTDTELRASAVPVDGSGVTQPISAVSLPLPTGAATEATLTGVENVLLTIDGTTQNIESNTGQTTTAVNTVNTSVNAFADKTASAFVSEPYDYQSITYVTVGNGIGEIETVIYKTGGSGGTTVATLTMSYDANDRLSSVTRT